MNKYRTKISHAFANGFITVMVHMLNDPQARYDDDDKLMLAALVEVKNNIYQKLATVKKEYAITLTPVQALALRLLYTQFINDPTTYLGSKLMLISNEVDKLYTNVI